MIISDYLKEIEFAVQNLMSAIWGERERLLQLDAEINSLGKIVEDKYERAEFVQMNAEDPDDLAMGVGMHWDAYFNEDKEHFYKKKDKDALNQLLVIHSFSIASLSGALLQYAKQGMSIVYGPRVDDCPDSSRVVGSQNLKQVIWQGRNQAIHWEEGKPHPAVVQCFDALAKDVDVKFADYKTKNLAFDVVELLGWTTFDEFRKDVLTLVSP